MFDRSISTSLQNDSGCRNAGRRKEDDIHRKAGNGKYGEENEVDEKENRQEEEEENGRLMGKKYE